MIIYLCFSSPVEIKNENVSLVKTLKTRFVKKGEKRIQIVDFTVQRYRFFFKIKRFSQSVYELVEPLSGFDFSLFSFTYILLLIKSLEDSAANYYKYAVGKE